MAPPSSPAPFEPPPAFQQGTLSNAPVLETPAFFECSRLSAAAIAIVTQAERSVAQCETAADCRSYDLSDLEICWSVCGYSRFGGPAQERAVRAAIQHEDVQGSCADFKALGCTVLPPSCPQASPVPANFAGYQCNSQQCEPVLQ
jgi:hypothetical protein